MVLRSLRGPGPAFVACVLCVVPAAVRAAEVRISEFMADNRRTLLDRDGEPSDWIELHNPSPAASVNLRGWSLTDDAGHPAKWMFPNHTLLPNSYVVVFASGKNRTNTTAELHTNFRLGAGGEYLALVAPGGTNVVSAFAPAYPPQQPDISYGRERTDPAAVGYFAQPTPGAPNATAGPGFAPAVAFTPAGRPFFDAVTVALGTDAPDAVIRYTLDGSPPTAASLAYAGPLTFTNRVRLRARAFLPDRLPGPVRTEAYARLSESVRGVTSDLPILLLDTFGRSVPNDGDLPAHLWVFEPRGGRAALTNAPSFSARLVTDRRGSSTEGQAKPNLNLTFRDETDDDRDVAFLGLPAGSDWVLHAPYNFDPAGFRNPLAYTLSRQAGRYAPRHRFAELYLVTGSSALNSGHYHGLYNVLERVKRGADRVDVETLGPADNAPPEVTGGYIVKVDRLGPGEAGFAAGGQHFAHVYPREPVINTPQRAGQRAHLAGALDALAGALYGPGYRDPRLGYAAHLDVAAAVDHHVLSTFFYNVDALRLSTFLHKPRGGLVTWGPLWDFDRALGSTDGRDLNPRGWNSSGGTDFFHYPWWDRMFTDPDFWQRWIDRWQELRDTTFSRTNLFALVDALNAEIAEAVPRDFQRWGQPKRGGSQAGEIAWLKHWLTNRADFIDTNFVRRPVLSRPGGRFTPGETLALAGPADAALWYTLDGSDPRARGGGFAASARRYTAPLTLTTTAVIRVRAHAPGHLQRTGHPNPPLRSLWSGPVAARFTTGRPPQPGDLVFSEVNHHPPGPTPAETAARPGVTDDDFEFLELRNASPETLDLAELRFTDGVENAFATNRITTLAPGGHLVLVRNPAAFALRHGLLTNVAGTFTGALANSGERLRLADAAGRVVAEAEWADGWHPAADGFGFTLVEREPGGPRPPWPGPAAWRPSALPGGSPGRADPTPPALPAVVINELLTHAEPPLLDYVELHNAGDAPADVSGWWLDDGRDFERPFILPAGTVIPPRGFRVFTEDDFDPPGGAGGGFAFDARGEEVWLAATDGAGRWLGPADGFRFGAAARGVSFGRVTGSVGEAALLAERARTPGAPNAGPLAGPVVITEIHAAPASPWDAFIELKNITATNVPLHDPARPGNTWRLAGVDADLPADLTLPPGGLAVLTAGEPAAFRGRWSVPAGVPVLGPWPGVLAPDGERLTLERPDTAADTGDAPRLVVDTLRFRALAPWPAYGRAAALLRRAAGRPGFEPLNWLAAPPTPGREFGGGDWQAWLAAHFNPAEQADPAVAGEAADPDGDGMTNLGEFLAGTDPRAAASRLELAAAPAGPGVVRLRFTAQAGRSYAVQARTPGGPWQTLRSFGAAAAPAAAEVDAAVDLPVKFFRVGTPGP
jgi:hypothetical protein